MLALSIFLASCTSPSSPAATVVVETGAPATATRTPLPTPSPTPTQIPPTASPTPTPNPFAALPELSQKYYGESNLEATNIANALQYIAGGAHPSNMCGPLAAQILQEAGIISPYIDIADFWLLNPRVQPIFLAEAFPPSRFSFIQSREPIQRYNFAANPLKAGDFLYLYAGPNGNFEHMLTVTRVDEAGRAYSVTNLNTDEGYLIDEYLLYDPNAAGEGLFYRWNDRDYEHLGLTGSGGFDLWRPNALWDAGDASLNTVLENIFITARRRLEHSHSGNGWQSALCPQ